MKCLKVENRNSPAYMPAGWSLVPRGTSRKRSSQLASLRLLKPSDSMSKCHHRWGDSALAHAGGSHPLIGGCSSGRGRWELHSSHPVAVSLAQLASRLAFQHGSQGISSGVHRPHNPPAWPRPVGADMEDR
jgi:hypothetical protein